MGQAIRASRTEDLSREDASLLTIVDGAGVGKTRIQQEIQACADMPSWNSLPKLGLNKETLQVKMQASLHLLMR